MFVSKGMCTDVVGHALVKSIAQHLDTDALFTNTNFKQHSIHAISLSRSEMDGEPAFISFIPDIGCICTHWVGHAPMMVMTQHANIDALFTIDQFQQDHTYDISSSHSEMDGQAALIRYAPDIGSTCTGMVVHEPMKVVLQHLDKDALLAIGRLKQDRTNIIRSLLVGCFLDQHLEDLYMLAVIVVSSGCTRAQRNALLDLVVLGLAERNCCHDRNDFDAALRYLLGDNLDTLWRSRFYNSVSHVLRVNGISCFQRRQKRYSCKNRSDRVR